MIHIPAIRATALLRHDFDRAVALYGAYIDNRLTQTDKEGKPMHRLPVLLRDPVMVSGRSITPREIPDWVKRRMVVGTVEDYG